MEDRCLSVVAIGDYFGIERDTVYTLISEKACPHIKSAVFGNSRKTKSTHGVVTEKRVILKRKITKNKLV